MLYLLQSQVHPPTDLSPEKWGELARAELEYGIQKRHEGKLVDIWRVAGEYAAVSIWDALDNDELHQLISNLPMFAYADFKVIALATHPSTIRWREVRESVTSDKGPMGA
jgi:muconolactone D-isomerase